MRKITILKKTENSYILVGTGKINGHGMICDCPATLDEELYEKIEDRIVPGSSVFVVEYNGDVYEVEIGVED